MADLLKFAVIFVVSCISCVANTTPANLSILRHEVKAYHDSGEYYREINVVASEASRYLKQSARKNRERKHPLKLALVLDIDETILSNYGPMVKNHFTTNAKQQQKIMKAANAPVIKPIYALYQQALKEGVAVFFVTGRRDNMREATIRNFRKVGIKTWAGLYMKPQNYNRPSVIPYKADTRAKIARQGYTIIASIGDQCSDLEGGYANRIFKLPNPYYHIP